MAELPDETPAVEERFTKVIISAPTNTAQIATTQRHARATHVAEAFPARIWDLT